MTAPSTFTPPSMSLGYRQNASVLAGLLPALDITGVAGHFGISDEGVRTLEEARGLLEAGHSVYDPPKLLVTGFERASKVLRERTPLASAVWVPLFDHLETPSVPEADFPTPPDANRSLLRQQVMAEVARVGFFLSPPDGKMRESDLIFKALSLTALTHVLNLLDAPEEPRAAGQLASKAIQSLAEEGFSTEAAGIQKLTDEWNEQAFAKIAGDIPWADRLNEISKQAQAGDWEGALFEVRKINRYFHHTRALALVRLAAMTMAAGQTGAGEKGPPSASQPGGALQRYAEPRQTSEADAKLLADFFIGGYPGFSPMPEDLPQVLEQALQERAVVWAFRDQRPVVEVPLGFAPGRGFFFNMERLSVSERLSLRVFSRGGRKIPGCSHPFWLQNGDVVQVVSGYLDRKSPIPITPPFIFEDIAPVPFNGGHRYPSPLPKGAHDFFAKLKESMRQWRTLTLHGHPVLRANFYPSMGYLIRTASRGPSLRVFADGSQSLEPLVIGPGDEKDLILGYSDVVQVGDEPPFLFDLETRKHIFSGGWKTISRGVPEEFVSEALKPATKQPGERIVFFVENKYVGVTFDASTEQFNLDGNFIATAQSADERGEDFTFSMDQPPFVLQLGDSEPFWFPSSP